jgi:hypothetical protein
MKWNDKPSVLRYWGPVMIDGARYVNRRAYNKYRNVLKNNGAAAAARYRTARSL